MIWGKDEWALRRIEGKAGQFVTNSVWGWALTSSLSCGKSQSSPSPINDIHGGGGALGQLSSFCTTGLLADKGKSGKAFSSIYCVSSDYSSK